MDALAMVRGLVKTHPNRLWTLRELAGESGFPLRDTKAAIERLIARGELVRKGEQYYYWPSTRKAE